jgi:hypothetical protein
VFKAGKVTWTEVRVMYEHIEQLFAAFVSCLTQPQREALVNPLASKFINYKTFKV